MASGRGTVSGRGKVIQMLLEAAKLEKSESESSGIQTQTSQQIVIDDSDLGTVFRGVAGRGRLLNISDETNLGQTTFVSGTDSHQESTSGRGSSMELVRSFGRGKVLQLIPDKSVVPLETTVGQTTFASETDTDLQQESTSGRGSSMELSRSFGRGKVVHFIADEPVVPVINLPKSEAPPAKIEQVTKKMEEVKIEIEPVIRRGTTGRPAQIIANYIRLKTDPTKGVFEYEVRFAPDVHSMQMRYKLLNQHRDKIGNTKTFDGVLLYLPIDLPQSKTDLISTNDHDGSSIIVTIIYKKKKLMKDCIQLYNVLFDRIMKILKFVRFGRKTFDPTAPKLIPQHKLEIWPGYVTAVDEYEEGVMLCLDVSHRLLCQETVLDVLTHAYMSDKNNFQQNAMQALLGEVVLTRYNNKTYRIDDIMFNESPNSTFVMNGKDVSYLEYYKSHYNLELLDKKQPLLVNRQERLVSGKEEKETLIFCLMPELCYLTGISDTIRSDLKVMRDIATVTRVTPNQRVDAMNTFCNSLTKCKEASDVLRNWGLELESKPIQLTGRQLADEDVIFGNKKIIRAEKGDFNKYCCNNQLFKVVNLTDWILIHTKRDTKFANSFIDVMLRNCGPMGIKVSEPKVECLNDDKNELYVSLLRKVIKPNVQIIVIICPTSRDDRYAAIKKVCCGELPIPTQIINSCTLANEQKRRSIIAKIALQMNCKIGGSLWSINIPFKNVMICGIDTYHDSKKKDNSVGAFVSSLNGTFTEWYSRAAIQSQKEELINGLNQSMVNALRMYKQRNGVLPEKIIIFRDGVGDGQLKMVKEYEIPQLLQACSLENQNYAPLLTFIVVQKRINTRLFAVRHNGLDNPAPGCIIDHSITRRYLYDFFLVPQNVAQGTVSPTHYIVLEDANSYSPDILQRLSYKMCFLYYNWPGTVRVPACCQYAHKLAFLVGQSVKKQPAEVLADKLYYL